MEAKQSSIAYFMKQPEMQFTIPVYQRNYDWRNEQCRQLLADILAVGGGKETDEECMIVLKTWKNTSVENEE